MKEWKLDLHNFEQEHAFLSEKLELIKKDEDWVKLNELVEDCSKFNQSILESDLMIEYSKRKETDDFKKARAEGGQLEAIENRIIHREISKEVHKIANIYRIMIQEADEKVKDSVNKCNIAKVINLL